MAEVKMKGSLFLIESSDQSDRSDPSESCDKTYFLE